MKRLIVIILIFSIINYGFSQNYNYKIGDALNIFALSGLKLRSEANIKCKVVCSMKFGEKVIVLDTFELNKATKQTIDGLSGHWIKVQYGTFEGYVFDGFLSSLPIPKIDLKKSREESKLKDKTEYYDCEGWEVEKLLQTYIKTEFFPVGDALEYYNGVDGESLMHLTLQKLTGDFVGVSRGGWENGSLELQMPNTRLSEVKNLLTVLLEGSGTSNRVIKQAMSNLENFTEDKQQVIFGSQWLTIIIRKYPRIAKWSIELTTSM